MRCPAGSGRGQERPSAQHGCSLCEGRQGTGLVDPSLIKGSRFSQESLASAWLCRASSTALTGSVAMLCLRAATERDEMKARCLQRPPGTPSRARQAHPSLSLARRRGWDTGINWKLLLQTPLRSSPVPEAFPWSRARHGSTRPRSVPSPTSAAPTHHRRLHTASPHTGPSGAVHQALGTELPSDPMLPAARPPALPTWLHSPPTLSR